MDTIYDFIKQNIHNYEDSKMVSSKVSTPIVKNKDCKSTDIKKYKQISNPNLEFIEEKEVDQTDTIYDAFFNKYFEGWTEEFLQRKTVIENINTLISKSEIEKGEFYPHKDIMYNAFDMTPLKNVKVVIWGQDPYPQLISKLDRNGELYYTPRAQGYSFGVSKEDDIPSSLKNIYKEIRNEYPMFEIPDHGDLKSLAEQGIFFMNTSLTYCVADPKAHQKLWMRFVCDVIDIINENIDNCVHVLWGKNSQKLSEFIRSRNILESSHPSGLSANRGFFGNNHFIKMNILLKKSGKEEINFNKLNDNWEELEPTYISNLKKIRTETKK